jgi:hypothetical protein
MLPLLRGSLNEYALRLSFKDGLSSFLIFLASPFAGDDPISVPSRGRAKTVLRNSLFDFFLVVMFT